VTMTTKPSENPATEAVRSLEVRWIFPGQLETAVAGWFGRFPASTESREDTYLLHPRLPGLSVQIRGDRVLELKAYRAAREPSRSPAAPAGAWSLGRSGRFPVARCARAAPPRPAGRG
jgi:hypothetical protein